MSAFLPPSDNDNTRSAPRSRSHWQGWEVNQPQINDFNFEALPLQAPTPSGINLHGASLLSSNGDVPLQPQHSHIGNLFSCAHETTYDLIMDDFRVYDAINKHSAMVKAIWPSFSDRAAQQELDFAHLYSKVKSFNLPNYLGAQLQLNSGLNIEQWDLALVNYHDKTICQFIKFGWPVGYLKSNPPSQVKVNHPSANAHAAHVQKFIQQELEFQAILGPFSSPPFVPWVRTSPLMTRPKKQSDDRRVIVDLSFPAGEDVNSGIDIDSILGRSIKYSLPSITDLITRLQLLGPGAYIWKADLARAYRQLRLDPLDVPLMGFKFKDLFYLDLCPPFGCRSSSSACQRCSNAVIYILAQAGVHALAYLDDFAGAQPTRQEAASDYSHFLKITASLGLKLADTKCLPPTQNIEWLGFQIDTAAMSVAIPKYKLEQVLSECQLWMNRHRASKAMIQSLVGKLVHISNCIPAGRRFIARILDTLRRMEDRVWTTINTDFLKDVQWFTQYAQQANGVYFYEPNRPEFAFECDSLLHGGGGAAANLVYTWTYSNNHKALFPAIHELEAVNLLVAYATFAHLFPDHHAHVIGFTDNEASAHALQSGRSKDKTLAACSRELWLIAAKHDHQLSIIHKPGKDIPLVDALSRMMFDQPKSAYVQKTISDHNLLLVPPVINDYVFFSNFI